MVSVDTTDQSEDDDDYEPLTKVQKMGPPLTAAAKVLNVPKPPAPILSPTIRAKPNSTPATPASTSRAHTSMAATPVSASPASTGMSPVLTPLENLPGFSLHRPSRGK